MPSNGVKRLYRTEDAGSTYYFVREAPHGETQVSESVDTGPEVLADATLITQAPLVECVNEAVYTPVSDYDDFWSLTVRSYLDSRRMPAQGVRGNMTFDGTAGFPVPGGFDLRGVYSPSTKTANPESVANPGIPPQLCDSNFLISRWNSGSPEDLVPRFRRWGLNLGRTPTPRPDGNASCDNVAMLEYLIAATPDPRWTSTIEVNENWNWEEWFRQGEIFALTIQIGQDDREKSIFSNYTPWGEKAYRAQLSAPPTYDTGEDGIRLHNLDWKLTGTNNNFLRIRHTT